MNVDLKRQGTRLRLSVFEFLIVLALGFAIREFCSAITSFQFVGLELQGHGHVIRFTEGL